MIWPDFCSNIILFVCNGPSFSAKEHFHSCFMGKIEEFDITPVDYIIAIQEHIIKHNISRA